MEDPGYVDIFVDFGDVGSDVYVRTTDELAGPYNSVGEALADWQDHEPPSAAAESIAEFAMSTQPCRCESSLCDHSGACKRPADPRLRMAYVVHACTQCAANMAATDGGGYVGLATRTLTTPELREGMIVHCHGMRCLLDRAPHKTTHEGDNTFAVDALVLNREHVPNGCVPYAFTEQGAGMPHRWGIQGNERARWCVETSV